MNQEEHGKDLNRIREVAEKYNLTRNKDKGEFAMTRVNLLGYIIEQGTLKPDPGRFKPLRQLNFKKYSITSKSAQDIPRFSEKIHAFARCTTFPLPQPAVEAFEALKKGIVNSVVTAIDDELPFTVETDASDHAIAATLSQLGKPVSFFSRIKGSVWNRRSNPEMAALLAAAPFPSNY
ncbi:conserved hypothetical protein [Trichinella spiralis]|uniref:hypothetical protein n=1 Tax=Trichinella spiralis TaxID=6334 RepID=UPI0001EFDC9B|nr:conserved hypothetical protein [Trichinella spiralis]